MDHLTAAAGAVVPCAVVGVAVALEWPWWAALAVLVVAVAVYARVAKRDRGLAAAMFAAAAFVLVVERRGAAPLSVRFVELGALVVLVIIAAVAGGLPEV